jgi:uroporphyrinogen-III synthase
MMGKLKNILISQPEPIDLEKSPYSDLVNKHKINIDFQKFIKIEGITASEFRKDKVYIQDYTAIIFTSRNAVDHFFRISKEMRVEIPESMKYFCISEATAFYLQKYVQYRKRKIFNSQQNFDDLLEIIKKNKDEKYLLPCSDIHTLSITKSLDDNKINYRKAVIYKTVASDLAELNIGNYDLIVFFSPAGVKSLFKNFPQFSQNSTLIGAFGAATYQAATEAGLNVGISAPTKTAMSMPVAIEQYLQETYKRK